MRKGDIHLPLSTQRKDSYLGYWTRLRASKPNLIIQFGYPFLFFSSPCVWKLIWSSDYSASCTGRASSGNASLKLTWDEKPADPFSSTQGDEISSCRLSLLPKETGSIRAAIINFKENFPTPGLCISLIISKVNWICFAVSSRLTLQEAILTWNCWAVFAQSSSLILLHRLWAATECSTSVIIAFYISTCNEQQYYLMKSTGKLQQVAENYRILITNFCSVGGWQHFRKWNSRSLGRNIWVKSTSLDDVLNFNPEKKERKPKQTNIGCFPLWMNIQLLLSVLNHAALSPLWCPSGTVVWTANQVAWFSALHAPLLSQLQMFCGD